MTLSNEQKAALSGMRVLLVEDSFLIAYSIRRILMDLGCYVVGPVSSVAEAIQLIEHKGCDAALLDVNLGDETSIPIAELLTLRNTPFIFVTGYSSPALAHLDLLARRRLRKPLTAPVLGEAMLEDFIRHR